MDKKILLAMYGTDNVETILENKKSTKQNRAHAAKKPERVPLTANQAQSLCAKAGVNYLDGYENRVLEYTITNETTDRYGDIVRAKGVGLNNYRKNPVMNFVHDNSTFPVGNTIKIWHDGGSNSVKAWGLFADDRVDRTGVADTTFKFASNGFMKACSIGFMPVESKRPDNEEDRVKSGLGPMGVEFIKSDLLEWSPCSVPANPDALQNSVAKSLTENNRATITKYKLFSDDMIEKLEELANEPEDKKFEETDNEVAFIVRQSGRFRDDSFRRVPLKRTKPKVNSVMGKLKVNEGKDEDPLIIQSLKFPKKDGWTVEKAQTWIDEHPDVTKEMKFTADFLYDLEKISDASIGTLDVLKNVSYHTSTGTYVDADSDDSMIKIDWKSTNYDMEELKESINELKQIVEKQTEQIEKLLKSHRSNDSRDGEESVYDDILSEVGSMRETVKSVKS